MTASKIVGFIDGKVVYKTYFIRKSKKETFCARIFVVYKSTTAKNIFIIDNQISAIWIIPVNL